MRSYTNVLATLGIALTSLGYVGPSIAQQHPVTAIDILLLPDPTMLRHAESVNASHLKVYPQGFALDATHNPHVTMIQRFPLRTADLDNVYAAVGKTIASANETGIKPGSLQILLHSERGHRPVGHCRESRPP